MIGVTILYPREEGSTFDIDYYTNSHMPMFAGHLGEACQAWGVIAADGPQYHCVGWAMVDSADAFNSAMAEHGAEIIGDVPNYTTVTPTLIVGNVVK